MTPEERNELEEWILTRPKHMQEMILRFPPHCTVRAKEGWTLVCPAPGVVAPLLSYVEHLNCHVAIRVTDGHWGAECEPDWIEIVDEGDYPIAEVRKLLGLPRGKDGDQED